MGLKIDCAGAAYQAPQPSGSELVRGFGVDSEYGRLDAVLLAEPSHLSMVPCNSVTRESLRNGLSASSDRALHQHGELVRALEAEGVKVHLVPAANGLPDLAFTRDTSLMTPWGLLGLRPGAPHRRREVDAVLAAAAAQGIPVIGRVERGRIEGGDVAILRPGLVVIGVSGERTTEEGADELAGFFRRRGWRALIYRFDPHFLHLDTLFCTAGDGLAVACLDVLEESFTDGIQALGIDLIPVRYKEVRRLGCNLLALGEKRVLTAGGVPRIEAELAARGYRVIPLDISEFTQCGGGVHCLTMPLRRAPG